MRKTLWRTGMRVVGVPVISARLALAMMAIGVFIVVGVMFVMSVTDSEVRCPNEIHQPILHVPA